MANAQDIAIYKQHMAALPPAARGAFARGFRASEKVKKPKTYYSTVRFLGTNTSGTLAIAAGVRNAFDYGKGDSLTGAGFASGTATERYTNLGLRGQREQNARVTVKSIALMLTATSDPEFAKHVIDASYAEISVDGINRHSLLGPLALIPGGGGLSGGGGNSRILEPEIMAALAKTGFAHNGQPHVSNVLKLTDPIIWEPDGAKDSKFQVRLYNEAISLTLPTARTAVAQTTSIAGVSAYVQPTTGQVGTYVDFLVVVKVTEEASRSEQE